MAKEKTRSNKEAKKPKKDKPASGQTPPAKGGAFPPVAEPKKKR
jgi:hypothetical protein